MKATFPAVSASVMASMTTGVGPGVHGVIAGGIFRRQCQALSLDERSNTLLNKKRFWHGIDRPRPKVSLLFWANPLAGAADCVIGSFAYGPSSEMISDTPLGLYADLCRKIGPFEPADVRGPAASWRASRWIAPAASILWRTQRPDLQWVYLPGINFQAIRDGVGSDAVLEVARAVDGLVKTLAESVLADGGQVIVTTDGGYVDVSRFAQPNLLLRRAGLLKTTTTDAGEVIDYETSPAMVMVDHQVGHLYCRDAAAAEEAAAVLAADPAIAAVVPREELFAEGLGRDRSGERIVLARPDAWLAYRWWEEGAAAPTFAAQSDAAGKCGYDPCELFAGRSAGTIDLRLSNIRASRGLVTLPAEDQCTLAASCGLDVPSDLNVTHLPQVVRKAIGNWQ
jgi:predicted AlkP superfamily pyrophosphatase or phosphodiesterase